MQTINVNGIPIFVPNSTTSEIGYYISYNSYDISAYGCVTTALVPDDRSYFFILNGDHRRAYNELKEYGYNACLEYFISQYRDINKLSDIPGHSWSTAEIVELFMPKEYLNKN